MKSVRIATWNVNSLKQRMPRLLPWLDERRPDVVCLQETKLADDALAELLGDELGPRLRGRGSRRGHVERGGDPLAGRPRRRGHGARGRAGLSASGGARSAATCGGVRVVSVYVPNGRQPGSDHYEYKLAWLARSARRGRRRPEETIVCGDMNIAPTDDDVRSGRLRRPDARDRAGARRAGRAPGARAARRGARPLAGRAGLHLLGLPRRACSTRTSACGST